jgi:mannose-6-phosphate isomerase-like protein (cupin superfamily)
MSPVVKRIDVRRHDPARMQKLNLFETPRFFCDVYCLLPEQAQKPHAHADADKIYVVLEGTVVAAIDDESVTLTAGDSVLAPAGSLHGVSNAGTVPAAVLVFMAPHP